MRRGETLPGMSDFSRVWFEKMEPMPCVGVFTHRHKTIVPIDGWLSALTETARARPDMAQHGGR